MAAVTGTAVTNVSLVKNTGAEITYTAATNAGTAGTDTETFDITPTVPDSRLLIVVKNGCGAAVTFSLLKGGMWASTADLTAVTVADGKTFGISVDTAKFKSTAGKISVKVTPTAGTALSASSKVSVGCVQLPA
jgi:hypothetical protein